MNRGLFFAVILLTLAPVAAAAQPRPATAPAVDAQTPGKLLYAWVARLLQNDTPESAADDGFALVLLRDKADPRNKIVCNFLSDRPAFYDPFESHQQSGVRSYKLRPVYWPSKDPLSAFAQDSRCDRLGPAFDFVHFGPYADSLHLKGGAPVILIFRSSADYRDLKASVVFDFTNLSAEETAENLGYFSWYFNRPSQTWPTKQTTIGLRRGQRVERIFGALPGFVGKALP